MEREWRLCVVFLLNKVFSRITKKACSLPMVGKRRIISGTWGGDVWNEHFKMQGVPHVMQGVQ